MPVRVLPVINYFFPVVLILGLLSCSKNDQSASVVFNSFFFFPGKDSSHIQASDHRIFVRVPENIISGTLVAEYSLSRVAGVYVNGVPQQSGITVNNFEHDLNYSINSSRVQEVWTVQASNNDYS